MKTRFTSFALLCMLMCISFLGLAQNDQCQEYALKNEFSDRPEVGRSGELEDWNLLNLFDLTSGGQQGVVSDGTYIYTCSWMQNPSGGYSFYKYDLQGNFIEGFNISGASEIRDLAYDGQYFYGGNSTNYLYKMDFVNKTLVTSISTTCTNIQHCSYDPERDGFWVGFWNNLRLINRSGQTLLVAPSPSGAHSSGYFADNNGQEHLYLFCELDDAKAVVYDYNITTNSIGTNPIFDFSTVSGFTSNSLAGGMYIGTYGGTMALFGNVQQNPNFVAIFELPDSAPISGTATVILTAGDLWGDGSGYQMLLDADANTYGSVIPTGGGLTSSGDASPEVYAQFEYKIPVNADGSLTTQNIVLNNSISIAIPAGVYDWCITNPTPGDRMWIAGSNGTVGGRQNDFTFEAGKTYEFEAKRFGNNDGVDLTITDTPLPGTYTITAMADPADGGNITGAGDYAAGASCTLRATANSGYSFVNWTKDGDVVYSQPEYTFTVTGNATYVAHFEASVTSYTISASANPSNGGTVTGGGTFAPGLTCTLTATPSEGFSFDNWTENGTVVSQDAIYSFTVDRNRTLVANFSSAPYFIISASATSSGNITPQGDIQVPAGGSQTFTITPDFGCRVKQVIVDGVDFGQITTYTFNNVFSNHSIHAVFSGWGVEESSAYGISVYPNPTSDRVVVKGSDVAEIQVYDIMGRVMRSVKTSNESETIDLHDLARGSYVMMITLKDGRQCYQNIMLVNE